MKKSSVRSAAKSSAAHVASPAPSISAPSATEAPLPLYNWLRTRGAGVLLHPTSLPSTQGVGVFDAHAMRFLDFLQQAGIKYWQLCPLGPTGYGDSPYACFSAFAGNPHLIDLAALVPHDLLDEADLAPLRTLPVDHVDFGALHEKKRPLLARAYRNFMDREVAAPYGEFEAFKHQHAAWLKPFAYFTALKDHFNGASWTEWPSELRDYASAQKSDFLALLEEPIERCCFTQYLFFGQWNLIRSEARARGIEIVGDLPIFVALDSADAWSNPGLFELDPQTKRPLAVAGVPPDYFSADGQLWGNPLYDWAAHRAEGYRWWIERLRAAFELYDVVRIDHFRGFDTYWRIPLPAVNAKQGEWRQGPGLELFRAFQREFPAARIIAEDLGDLTPSVRELLAQTGLPGMLVLQFAFGGDASNSYLPHHATPNSVIYPGTHDNDTTVGWYRSAPEHDRDYVRRYLRVSGQEISWDFLRAAYASASRLAVIPLQDIFAFDSAARFNTPGKPEGNWQWRYRAIDLEMHFAHTTKYLRDLAQLYGR